jgi:hypothetical protein
VSKNTVVTRTISKLPAAVKRFWGPPPIYRTEKEEDYWSFAAAIAHDLDPTDSIMMLLVKDVVDYSWEIRKLRKHQTQLSVLAKLKFNEGMTPQATKRNEKHYFPSPHGEADLFVSRLDDFEAIDRLLGLAEGRRIAALREIERYRTALAERLRERSEHAIIDGEFSEAAPHAESGLRESAKTDGNMTDNTNSGNTTIDSVETTNGGNESFEPQDTEPDVGKTEKTKTEGAKPDRDRMPGDPA